MNAPPTAETLDRWLRVLDRLSVRFPSDRELTNVALEIRAARRDAIARETSPSPSPAEVVADHAHHLWIAWSRGRLAANDGRWKYLEDAIRAWRPDGDIAWLSDQLHAPTKGTDMLVTVVVCEAGDHRDIFVIPEANIGADTRTALKLAAGHYIAAGVSNPPDVADALNTVLQLIAGDWRKYKIAGGHFEDNDYGIVRVVVLGWEGSR
jgi:hypothetical protein